jgi:hypothetical protein
VQSLGLTMIVKDEPSERVAALVDFLSPLLSQAVILDTGSALYDEDLRKSKTWDFKVEYDQIPWQPDFSVMRNQSLERLNTDWALALDADEIVSLGLAAAIKRVLEEELLGRRERHQCRGTLALQALPYEERQVLQTRPRASDAQRTTRSKHSWLADSPEDERPRLPDTRQATGQTG